MNDFFTEPEIAVFRDRQTNAETAIIALVSEQEFARARTIISGLNAYFDYEDWRESREGFRMGLAMAGVHVEGLAISVSDFVEWSACVSQISEPSIDRYAQLLLEHFDLDRGE
jgi:hypothetical protein